MTNTAAAGEVELQQSLPWVTLGAAAVLLAVFALQAAAFKYRFEELELVYLGANAADLVRSGEWYRLVTGSLLHANFRHLGLNVICLLVLGAYLEPIVGRGRYLLLLLGSALAGSLASVLFTDAGISVGASTAAFGLVGATVYLALFRWSELPRGMWLPFALSLVLLLSELRGLANPLTDTPAHWGGAAFGASLTALFTLSRPLVSLTEERAPAVLVAAALAAVVFAGGLAYGAQRVAQADRSSVYRWAEARLHRPDLGPIEVNNRAYLLAQDATAPRQTLEFARDRLKTMLASTPAARRLHAIWDTLAVLHYRLGEHALAVDAERTAIALVENPEQAAPYAENLARFERAHSECCGLLRFGPAPRQVELRLEPLFDAASGERSVRIDLSEPSLHGLVVHALVLENGRVIGLADARLGPGHTRELFGSAPGDERPLPPGATFEVTLIDARPGLASSSALRVWQLDPERPPPLRDPVDS